MISLSWGFSPPWDWLVIVVVLIAISVPVFWLSLNVYQRRYFPGKAVRLAIIRTAGWMLIYGGSFALIFWLVSQQLPPGWLRYLVGGLIWWLLTEAVLTPAWRLIDRLLETW